MNAQYRSFFAIFSVSVLLAGCKKDTEFEGGQKDSDELIRSQYQNKYTQEQFLARATKDIDPLLNEVFDAFHMNPLLPSSTSTNFQNISAMNIMKSFSSEQIESSKLSLASADDTFFTMALSPPSAFEPYKNFDQAGYTYYRDIRVGDSCRLASYTVETGYSNATDYSLSLIRAMSQIDDNALPESIEKIETKDYASAYKHRLFLKSNTEILNSAYTFTSGGNEKYLRMSASGSTEYSQKSVSGTSKITMLLDRLVFFTNTVDKNIDIDSVFTTNVVAPCADQSGQSQSSIQRGFYLSRISLGKKPVVTDALLDATGNKNGYSISNDTSNCDNSTSNSQSALTGNYVVKVTGESLNELNVIIDDQQLKQTGKESTRHEFKTEWTFVKQNGECTVTKVVQEGQEIH